MYLEIAALVVGLYVVCFLSKKYLELRGMPPGPFPLPVIGNVLQIDHTKPHVSFAELSKKYGKIFTIQLGVQRVVVISGAEIARGAFLKNATAFAGRPPSYAGFVFSGGSKNIAFQTYSQMWKRQHIIALNAIRMCESKVNSLEEIIAREIEDVVFCFESYGGKPFNPRQAIFTAIINCMGSLCFGKRFESNTQDIQIMREAISCFRDNLGAASIRDAFPILKYFPFPAIANLAKSAMVRDDLIWRKFEEHKKTFDARNIRDMMDALIAARFMEGKENSQNGHSMIDKNKNINELLSDERIVYTCNDAFIAGTETPTSAILWVFALLAKNPDVQAKLHKELDDVIGEESVLTMQDKLKLPYTEAVIAETIRFISFMPLAIPHCTMKEVILEGYRIPKDTVVYLNLWEIQHDSAYFDDPFVFNPERFLDGNGKFVPKVNASYMPFSLGKRSCLGESIARTELFLFTAQLVHQFKFEPSPESSLPDPLNTPFGIVLAPLDFDLIITKRRAVPA